MKPSKMPPQIAASFFILVTGIISASAEPAKKLTPFAAAAAIEKATIAEEVAMIELRSRSMAKDATREIVRVTRARAQEQLDNLIAAREDLKRLKGVEKEMGSERLKKQLARFRAAGELLMEDAPVAVQAAQGMLEWEDKLEEKIAISRAAERTLLELKGPEVEKVWEALEAGADERYKNARKVDQARKANPKPANVHEADALLAWETQMWARLAKETAGQIVSQTTESSTIATGMATAETDQKRKKALQDFATGMIKHKQAAEKLIAKKEAAIDATLAGIYPSRTASMGGLKPLAAKDWNYAKARHLLVRAGLGGTPQEVEKIHAMGLFKAVDYMVDYYRRPPASAVLDIVPPLPGDPLAAKVRNNRFFNRLAVETKRSTEDNQTTRLREWWLERIVESPRPLQEKLTLFWHGHFANQQSVVRNSYTMYQQNQLFREHAAGNFRGLLYGIVHDPAMLRYLDNNKNVKGHANENLAREIMELFSMGEDQGYTEADIREAGRALTGYNFDDKTGGFRLRVKEHDPGEKTIFGKKGNWSGDDLVNLILEQPATSRFIAKRLFEFFAYQDPDKKTIDRMSATLRARDYELAPMLKNLFQSEEFYSERAIGTKIKSPVQLVAGMMRDLGIEDVTNYSALNAAIESMGQKLLEPPDVKGWRRGRSWISANRMFTRYNSSADLLQTVAQPGSKAGVDVVALLESASCKNADDVVDYLVKACFDRPLTSEQRKKLAASLGQFPPPSQWAEQREQLNTKLRGLLVLMTSTPEYQLK